MNDFMTSIQPWYPSIGAFLFFSVIRYIYKNFVLKLLHTITNKIDLQNAEDVLFAFEHPINIILFVIAFYSAINLSPIASTLNLQIFDRILRSVIVFNFFWGLYNISDATHGLMLHLMERFGFQSENSISNIVSTLLRFLIVLIGFVTIAREWNYDITGFLASLSIGSVAVAFAAKDALANVFGSLIIILDKPFKTGDWIMANGIEGTVENVSFRSTCIRTFPQELVYIPNSLLSNTPITNFTMRQKRRIDFTLGLTYSTTAAQMEDFITRTKTYLCNNPRLHEDPVRVHFTAYNDSSLDVRIVCYAATGDHDTYLDIQQEVNFNCMRLMEEAGVSCAFPSTSVYFETPLEEKQPVEMPVHERMETQTVTKK